MCPIDIVDPYQRLTSVQGPVSITATATFVKVVWSGSNSNLVTGYTLEWFPPDGKIAAASPLSTTRIIRNLHPGTIYALRISPNIKRQEGQVKTIIFTTGKRLLGEPFF